MIMCQMLDLRQFKGQEAEKRQECDLQQMGLWLLAHTARVPFAHKKLRVLPGKKSGCGVWNEETVATCSPAAPPSWSCLPTARQVVPIDIPFCDDQARSSCRNSILQFSHSLIQSHKWI